MLSDCLLYIYRDSIGEADVDFCVFGLELHTFLLNKIGLRIINMVYVKKIKHQMDDRPLNE